MSEQEEFEFRLRLEQEQAPALSAEQQAYAEQGRQTAAQGGLRLGPEPRNPMAGGGEIAAALGSSALLAPLSGLAGLLGMALPGPNGQGGDWARGVQGMAYQPRTLEGQVGTEIVTAGPVALSKLADLIGEKVSEGPNLGPLGRPMSGSPLMGALVNAGIQAGPAALGVRGRAGPTTAGTAASGVALVEPFMSGNAPNVFRSNRAPNVSLGAQSPPVSAAATPPQTIPLGSIRNPQNRVKLETWQEANRAGYVFPPTHIEDSFLRKKIESIGGKAATKQEATQRNAIITDELAREGASIPKGTPIDEGALEAARTVLAAPYREVASLSPRAASALDKLKDVRAEAKIYRRHADISGDPRSVKEAMRLDQTADAYENLIDKEAARAGRPDLLNQLRESRRLIAMNWDVDRALNVGDGHVDAMVLARLLDKRGVGGMSGPLLTIAKTAKAFPQFMRSSAGTPTAGVSALEPAFAAGAAMAGHGAVAAGWPLVQGPARALALSPRMQTPLRAGTAGLSLRDVARGATLPLAITPSLGLRPPPEE